ncbi:IPT/TIG domain-containing protein [Nitrospira sp. Kam-Ns4a]
MGNGQNRSAFYAVLLGGLFAAVGGMSGVHESVGAAPTVSPETLPPGATLTITGSGFGRFVSSQVNRVLIGGLPALVQRWELDRVEVKVPLRAASGPVEVFAGHKGIRAGTVTVRQPEIHAVEPAEAEPGTVLRIRGRYFGPTAGSQDPNVMFGVNDVLISGEPARAIQWRDDLIEVKLPPGAMSGQVVVRLASSDPLRDGSCCAPVEYALSNAVPLSVRPAVRVDPLAGPVGTKVVLFGGGFGSSKAPDDAVLFNGRPATVAEWSDSRIVVHVPLNAESGPLVIRRGGTIRTVGLFTVWVPTVTGLSPSSAPIGSLLRITGEHFGQYSESGATPFAFLDFDKGENGVEIGGVPAIVYRWHDDKIDVWVPYSAKSGPVVIKRGATVPKPDGSCCAERGVIRVGAEQFQVVTPRVESVSPMAAGVDDLVTIRGAGFGDFLRTFEATQPGLNEGGHEFALIRLEENVARTEVLFNGVSGIIQSWTDREIVVRVPRRNAFGIGGPGVFHPDLRVGPLVVRRGSWDLLPDGSCCTPKRWVSAVAGDFTILPQGLPDQGYFEEQPGRD